MGLTPAERKHLIAQVDNRAIRLIEGLAELARRDSESRLIWEQAQQMAGRARGPLVVAMVKDKRAT